MNLMPNWTYLKAKFPIRQYLSKLLMFTWIFCLVVSYIPCLSIALTIIYISWSCYSLDAITYEDYWMIKVYPSPLFPLPVSFKIVILNKSSKNLFRYFSLVYFNKYLADVYFALDSIKRRISKANEICSLTLRNSEYNENISTWINKSVIGGANMYSEKPRVLGEHEWEAFNSGLGS